MEVNPVNPFPASKVPLFPFILGRLVTSAYFSNEYL